MRLLLVEDDADLADGLANALRQSDYAVDCVVSGEAAEVALQHVRYDLMVLDVGLPRRDGFEVLKRLRAKGSPILVLMLTARDDTASRIHGLDLGADDYLTKPFVLKELEARLRALTRRLRGQESLVRCGRLTLDTIGQRILSDAAPLELTRKEYQVLAFLIERRGKVVSKENLFQRLYDWNSDANLEVVEVYVSRVRKKIEPAGVSLRVVRGLGYLLEDRKDELERPV
ncbi:MAG: Response regulator receiver:Transcriptional regulatory protein C-terminal [Herminiimonas sp.]|nr:Response regulator receiver:Transcriptional regulatory protein C-terminal [Herminiimonas sp.]